MALFESVSRWIQQFPVVRRSRAGPRVSVNEQALLHIPARLQTHRVLLRDIAVGGACIRTDLRLAPGEEVWLCVDAGTEAQFEINASVLSIRQQDPGFYTDYGLRLVGLNLQDARTLDAFIVRRLESEKTKKAP